MWETLIWKRVIVNKKTIILSEFVEDKKTTVIYSKNMFKRY